jgi:hypothetical protein
MVERYTAQDIDRLIGSPCFFCGYNGAGYYQAKTHREGCPWHSIGGREARNSALLKVLEGKNLDKIMVGKLRKLLERS